jgi:SanA protein
MLKKVFIRSSSIFVKTLVILVLGLLIIVFLSNLTITLFSYKHTSDHIDELIPHKAALVLGTSSHFRSGAPNEYFHNRIKAAAELYHAGKVEYLILSGDNRTRYYNEPQQMRLELLKYNIPDSIVYLDYAGLRTLDSVIRCREVFGQNSFIVVSQKFHNQRAIFLGRVHGLKVSGYNAKDISSSSQTPIQMREFLARVKVFIDLITRKGPKHLGETIVVG